MGATTPGYAGSDDNFIRQLKGGMIAVSKVGLGDEGEGREIWLVAFRDYPNFQVHMHVDELGHVTRAHIKSSANDRSEIYPADAYVIQDVIGNQHGRGLFPMFVP